MRSSPALTSARPREADIGTALTFQLATRFILNVFTILLVPEVRDTANRGLGVLPRA